MLNEMLESRRLMSSASVTFTQSGSGSLALANPNAQVPTAKLSRTGTLFIQGTSVRDTIALTSSAPASVGTRAGAGLSSALTISVKLITKTADGSVLSATVSFLQSNVKRIDINAGAGNDLVDANTGIKGRTVIHGGKGDDQLITTGKSNSLFGDSGDDILTSSTSVASLHLSGLASGVQQANRVVPVSSNLLTGGDGNDTFRSRGGDDSIVGGNGDDRYEPLEAGIVATTGTTLPTVSYPSGTAFGASRIAISDVETTAADPTGLDTVKIYVNGSTVDGFMSPSV